MFTRNLLHRLNSVQVRKLRLRAAVCLVSLAALLAAVVCNVFAQARGTPKFVYVIGVFANYVSGYTFDSTSGALAPIPGSPFATGSHPYFLAVDPSGRFVYVTNYLSNSISV